MSHTMAWTHRGGSYGNKRPQRMGRSLLVLLIGVMMLLLAPPAGAQGYADEADLHFRLGAEAYQANDYNKALEHFLASNRLVPNRNVVFNIARTYERLNRYTDAYRYYVDARQAETKATTQAELDAAIKRIAPQVAVLRVVSDPPGATVFLNRKDLGARAIAPKPVAVKPGKYQLIVELKGHEPVTRAIETTIGNETLVQLKLERIVGTARIGVAGGVRAEVRVGNEDAEVACMAPCDLQLAPGNQLLYFSAKGYEAAPRQVAIVARKVTPVTAKLTTLRGSLVVESEERGAIVEIDGKSMGFTPAVIQNVAVGKRAIKVSMRGFKPYEKTVEVRANGQVKLLGIRMTPLREVQAVSRVAEDVDSAPSSLTIIDGQELRAFGYPTIASALRGVRGVYVSNDRTYTSAGIRGVGEPNDYGNRVLVLQDGMNLNDNLLNSSYIGSDGRNDLMDLERIEVVRGPGSLLYGTGAFSGVVNLVPRSQKAPSQVLASMGVYDNGVMTARGGGHYNFNDEAGIWGTVSGARSDGFSLPINRIDPGDGPQVQNADKTERVFAVGTTGRAWWRYINAQWLYQRRKQFIPVGALATTFNDPRTFYLDERVAGELRVEPKFDKVDIFTRAHANHYHFGGRYISDAPDPSLEEDYYGTWFGVEARAVFRIIEELTLTVGAEGQFHPVAKMEGTEVDEQFNPLADGSYLSESQPYNFGAGYVLLSTKPNSWFSANAGVRVDVYSTFGPIVVPRGALIFKPTDGGVLKLMGGRAFRAPSIYEQYYNDGGFSQLPAVDEARQLKLGAESIYAGEIEYLQRFEEDWVATVSGHFGFIDGLINTVEDAPGSDVIRYSNTESPIITAGGDAEIRRDWRRGWMVAAFYSYQRAMFIDNPDPVLQANPRVPNAPEHMAGVKGVVPLVTDLASLAARAAMEAPRRFDRVSLDTTKTAVIMDAALSGFIRDYGVRYVVGVYNLFDWKYELPVADTFASRTIRQNGRTFRLNLSLEYP